MKKHAIIPIFISHRGCPHACTFCNQKSITSRTGDVTVDQARQVIEQHLTTLGDLPADNLEIAFYGGSFTGIPIDEQNAFLTLAASYKDAGKVGKIHMSTRPDYINEAILDNLKSFGVDTIELGVQSFDEEVLRLCERGCTADDARNASHLIKQYGFTLGIQLMVGLSGDSLDKCIYSAQETVKLAPEIARIYPTVVLQNTALYDSYMAGSYTPLTEEDAIVRSKAIYEILDDAGINIIRVGLKSSEIMNEQMAFHPAFRQLVEDRIARERMERLLTEYLQKNKEIPARVLFEANEKCYNNLFGHHAQNRIYFEEKYPELGFDYAVNPALADNEYIIKETK